MRAPLSARAHFFPTLAAREIPSTDLYTQTTAVSRHICSRSLRAFAVLPTDLAVFSPRGSRFFGFFYGGIWLSNESRGLFALLDRYYPGKRLFIWLTTLGGDDAMPDKRL